MDLMTIMKMEKKLKDLVIFYFCISKLTCMCDGINIFTFLATPPGRRVQFLLGKENEGLGHEPHPVFCEMEELYTHQNGEMEWRETARYIVHV